MIVTTYKVSYTYLHLDPNTGQVEQCDDEISYTDPNKAEAFYNETKKETFVANGVVEKVICHSRIEAITRRYDNERNVVSRLDSHRHTHVYPMARKHFENTD